MRNLINRILVKLGLRKPPPIYANDMVQIYVPEGLGLADEEMKQFETIGWKFYGGYGRMNNQDFIVRGEIVEE